MNYQSTIWIVHDSCFGGYFWCHFGAQSHVPGTHSSLWLGCDIGGAKELRVIYFPTNWGAKEPQNLPNHRVVIVIHHLLGYKYLWSKKSCTIWDVQTLHGRNYLLSGAGLLRSTGCLKKLSKWRLTLWIMEVFFTTGKMKQEHGSSKTQALHENGQKSRIYSPWN